MFFLCISYLSQFNAVRITRIPGDSIEDTPWTDARATIPPPPSLGDPNPRPTAPVEHTRSTEIDMKDSPAFAADESTSRDPLEGVYRSIRGGSRSLFEMKKHLERECIARALEETSGNITRAAALLGMKRPRLSQLVKQYELTSERTSSPSEGAQA